MLTVLLCVGILESSDERLNEKGSESLLVQHRLHHRSEHLSSAHMHNETHRTALSHAQPAMSDNAACRCDAMHATSAARARRHRDEASGPPVARGTEGRFACSTPARVFRPLTCGFMTRSSRSAYSLWRKSSFWMLRESNWNNKPQSHTANRVNAHPASSITLPVITPSYSCPFLSACARTQSVRHERARKRDARRIDLGEQSARIGKSSTDSNSGARRSVSGQQMNVRSLSALVASLVSSTAQPTAGGLAGRFALCSVAAPARRR